MEGDIRFDEILNPKWAFQSTPSAWRETESRGVLSVSERFQSTPSAWRETFRLRTSLDHQHISIHSLRMEGDCRKSCQNKYIAYFNPLPPHGGRLVFSLPGADLGSISIHSLRMEGDSSPDTAEPMLHDISIHSLRMEGDNVCDCPVCIHCISIHSLRMEGDSDLFGDDLEEEEFQSTPSAWRETQYCILSPHSVINFNPLPPHGGRLATPSAIRYCSKFQSTPSAWRETYSSGGIWGCLHISIHSLRMEGDSFKETLIKSSHYAANMV